MINAVHFYGGQFGDLICKLLNGSEYVNEKIKAPGATLDDILSLSPGFYPTVCYHEEIWKNNYIKNFYINIKNTRLLDYTAERFMIIDMVPWQKLYRVLPIEYQKIIDSADNKKHASELAYKNMLRKQKLAKYGKSQGWTEIEIVDMKFDSLLNSLTKVVPVLHANLAQKIYYNWKLRELTNLPNSENILFS